MQTTNNSERLGTEPIVPLLFKLSIPSIIAMAIQALYNIVDSIYVAKISTESLSALTLAFPIQMVIIAVAVGTGVGTSSLISRLLGQGNKNRATNAAEHVVLIALLYGVIIGIFGFIFSDNLIGLFTSSQKLTELSSQYMRIIFAGSLALFFPMISNNILRGEGNTMIPMITMLIGSLLNIALDPLFIFGIGIFPAWGVSGAAFATVLSRIISGSFLLFILFSNKNELKINLKNFSFDLSIIKNIYQVGFPAMVMQFLASIMLSGMNWIFELITDDTTAVLAAAGIYFRLQSFVFMPVFGLNQGYMPLVGYNYGHKKPERMKKAIISAFLIALGFTSAGFLLFQLFPEQLIRMFNQDPDLIRIGTYALKTISLAFPIIGPAIIASTTFQAIGKGMPSLILSILRQIVVLLPLMFLLGRYYGLNALWYAFPISELSNAILAGIWLSYGLKKTFYRLEQQNI